ncbi:MAG TPA: hypothetical protein VNZ53_41865 [Steroidobacteraceae bacterium]|nr:hypothetical protein [Steroidobacteraceae bacterium]
MINGTQQGQNDFDYIGEVVACFLSKVGEIPRRGRGLRGVFIPSRARGAVLAGVGTACGALARLRRIDGHFFSLTRAHARVRLKNASALEAAFKPGGVHLVAVPADYSENIRVLGDELRDRMPAVASA